MAFEPIDRSPRRADFTPLSDHEGQTPGTFFGGKPVLHLHAPATKLKIPSEDFADQAEVRELAGAAVANPDVNGSTITIPDVDVWITSHHLILYAPAQSYGLQIPYPTIGVTAQDGADVLLELDLSDADTLDEDIEYMQMRIAPCEVELLSSSSSASPGVVGNGAVAPAAALFKAISDCQELNPDPVRDNSDDDDDDDDRDDDEGGDLGFDRTAPGASQWITSENMADFMDEDGNFKMPSGMNGIGDETNGEGDGLGAGAGRTRTAAEADVADGATDGEDSKWQRTG